MKKIIKTSLSTILIIVTLFMIATYAFGAGNSITGTILTKIANLPVTNNCDSVGGFAIGKKKNSMFSISANTTESLATFYYFPDISNPTNSKTFSLSFAGHANGMTIDGSNVYVTGWVNNTTPASYNSHNNIILMIRRSKIAQKTNGATLIKDNLQTNTENDFAVLHPIYYSNKDHMYKDYTQPISAITLYNGNGKFIIPYFKKSSDGYPVYTTAELQTINGKTEFVISTNVNDMFIFKNQVTGSGTPVAQDIYYAPGKGFFQAYWHKTGSATGRNNTILWADIDSTTTMGTVFTANDCRYCVPDQIKYTSSDTSYKMIEFESLAMDKNGRMLLSVNRFTSGGANADGIFSLTRSNGGNFSL